MITTKMLITLGYIAGTICKSDIKSRSEKALKYAGKKFPEKYLHAEGFTPSSLDLYKYLAALDRVLTHFNSDANDTCVNRAIGSFLAKAILLRTLRDDREKLEKPQLEKLKSVLHKTDNYLSHFIYKYTAGNRVKDEQYDTLKQYARMLQGSDILAVSLPDFNRNQLKNWILTDHNINGFIEDMDASVLPKEKYVELVSVSVIGEYHINIGESDRCIINLETNILPTTKSNELRRCQTDYRCEKAIHSEPSIAYGLSHRMLNLMMYRYQRHCYWRSPKSDLLHINLLCAFMYRESVYLARRGYFARDMFIEHVALCGMMGYEELFRRHWFYHVMRWIDGDGCIVENRNYWLNRTRFQLSDTELLKLKHASAADWTMRVKSNYKDVLRSSCEDHPMAVLMPFLANAIRYAAHFMSGGI